MCLRNIGSEVKALSFVKTCLQLGIRGGCKTCYRSCPKVNIVPVVACNVLAVSRVYIELRRKVLGRNFHLLASKANIENFGRRGSSISRLPLIRSTTSTVISSKRALSTT